MKAHVLDANALYRFLRNGPGAELVEDVFKGARRANAAVLMSVINWGEVHYSITRSSGIVAADAALRELENLPIAVLPADIEQTRTAAILKSSFGLPYADCFAAALSGKTGVLITAETKDFSRIPWLQLLPLPAQKRT
jgi:predicted nucleic acid-binding protein